MIINGLDTKDISFVVQGAVDKEITMQSIKSIRNNFPESEIILSTWKGIDVKSLDYDVLILSEDPGAVICDFHSIPNNINRQIKSSYAGLKAVKTKYAAKVRSDLIFSGPQFLTYFNRFQTYEESYKCVKSRMIILSLYTRLFYVNYDCFNISHANYHISDWFFFGYTEDVVRYFSVPLIDNLAEFSRYYLDKLEVQEQLPYPHLMSKLTPEQYLGSHFFGETKNDTIISIAKTNQKQWIKYLVNNFIVLDYEHSQIYSGKWEERSQNEWSMHPFEVSSLIHYADFLKYYKRYCDPSFEIPNHIDKLVFKRKMKILWDVLWLNSAKQYTRKKLSFLGKPLDIAKKIMRTFFPAYRASCGVRDNLLELREDELTQFNCLSKKIDEVNKQQENNNKEILLLKKQLNSYEEARTLQTLEADNHVNARK